MEALVAFLPADLAKLAAEFAADPPEIILAEQQGIEAVLSTTTGEVFSRIKGRRYRLHVRVYTRDTPQEPDDDSSGADENEDDDEAEETDEDETESRGVVFGLHCYGGPCIAELYDVRPYSPENRATWFDPRIIRWTKKDRDRVLALLLKHKVFDEQGAEFVRAILHPPPVSGPMDRFVSRDRRPA